MLLLEAGKKKGIQMGETKRERGDCGRGRHFLDDLLRHTEARGWKEVGWFFLVKTELHQERE